MTERTMIRTITLAASAFLCFAAQADVDVAQAKVFRLGPHHSFPGSLLVQLYDVGPTPLWTGDRQFFLNPALGNTGVATLLTALSLNQTVWVRIAGTGQDGSLINIIYLNAPE